MCSILYQSLFQELNNSQNINDFQLQLKKLTEITKLFHQIFQCRYCDDDNNNNSDVVAELSIQKKYEIPNV
jgi:hypothetical protein